MFIMKKYIRVTLGAKSTFAEEYFKGNFIGVDYGINEDLTYHLPENWRDFNSKHGDLWLRQAQPDTTSSA